MRYGGSISSGNAGYCAKGCAEMKGGKVIDRDKYCRVAIENRLSQCNAECSGASSYQDKRDICLFGCMFWDQSTGKIILIFVQGTKLYIFTINIAITISITIMHLR